MLVDLMFGSLVVKTMDLGLIPSWVKPMTLKLVFTTSCLTLSIEETVWKTNRLVYLLCRRERHLA